MDWLNMKLVYILSTCLFWLVYFVYTYKTDKNRFQFWGLSTQNFKQTFKELAPFVFIFILAFIVVGHFLKTSVLSWHIIPILLIYPVWGIFQQVLMVGLFTSNIKQLFPAISNGVLIVITALLFGLVHYPFYLLMIATFLLALVYTFLFLKGRNLLVFGIFHGWLGAFFYYCILHRDTLMEVFGR
ncbi:MAG: CPBP family intramembrane metalloprotease [Chitinophagales bacterium]|nr:CPBP family intramembrane metalloprotease [Chitinophagales bacterium]